MASYNYTEGRGRMVSEAQKRALRRYEQKMEQFVVKFRKDTDADVIARLKAVENRTGYIRELILKDVEEHGI